MYTVAWGNCGDLRLSSRWTRLARWIHLNAFKQLIRYTSSARKDNRQNELESTSPDMLKVRIKFVLQTNLEKGRNMTSSRNTMPRFCQFSCAMTSFSLMLLLVLLVAAPGAWAQEKTTGDSSTPLVYKAENTGAKFPKPAFPSFAMLPIIRPLPDPFLSLNGERDTSFANWERRRNEIKAAIEKYEIGPKPDCSDCTITAHYTPPAAGKGGGRGTLTVVVTRKGKSLTLTEGVYIPEGMGNGPFPALISMTFRPRATGPNYGNLPASVFEHLPIATVDFVHNQVALYTFKLSPHATDPFYQLYPELCAGVCKGTSNSGEYAAWSWGVSRLIDGMEIATHQAVDPLPIDMRRLAVTGCSYAGKMALFAGAFDERIALTIAQENGGGGAPSWRVSHEIEAEKSVEDIDTTSRQWFGGQMWRFAGDNVYKLPEDHDELMDMVAPRALLETGNTDYYWLTNRSNYVSARATQRVYNAFGIGDRFGFYIDGKHRHCSTLPAEAPAISSFVKKFMLGETSVASDVEVDPYPKLDYARWTWWWGKHRQGEPRFPNPWVADGTVVMPLNNGSSRLRIDGGQAVRASYRVRIPGVHPAATATLVNANVQADVDCADGSSYTLTIPLAANQSYSIPANSKAWVPDADIHQGSAAAPVCVGSPARGVLRNAYFSALGVSAGTAKPGGPGLKTTATTNPLDVRFACSTNGESTAFSKQVNVNRKP